PCSWHSSGSDSLLRSATLELTFGSIQRRRRVELVGKAPCPASRMADWALHSQHTNATATDVPATATSLRASDLSHSWILRSSNVLGWYRSGSWCAFYVVTPCRRLRPALRIALWPIRDYQ